MEPGKNKEHGLFVTLERLQQEAHKRRLTLCTKCTKRYEPCLAVILYRGVKVMHIIPIVHWEDGFRITRQEALCRLQVKKESVFYHVAEGLICGSPLYESPSFDSFIRNIIRKYPALMKRPITERALREVECDWEAEWALWQLAQMKG
jgi:hypothetical protein